MSADGLGALADCFSTFRSAHNGPVENRDPAFWVDRALAHEGEGTYQRTAVVTDNGGITGYASYFLEERTRRTPTRLVCKHLVATSTAALSCLIRYFRRFENAAKDLVWYRAGERRATGLALQSNGFAVSPVLDRGGCCGCWTCPRALEARGYPDVEGETVLEDPRPAVPGELDGWPWQGRCDPDRRGPWLASKPCRPKHAGRTIGRNDGQTAPAKTLPIGLFSGSLHGLGDAIRPGVARRPGRGRRAARRSYQLSSPAPFPGCPTPSRFVPASLASGPSLSRLLVLAPRSAPRRGAGSGSRCTIASRRVQRVRAT